MQLYKILEHITSDSEAKCIVLEEQDYDDIKKALIKKLYPNNQEEVVGQTTQDIMSTFVGKAGV
ncbi:hypothetical protein KAZ93_04020 [Patescibacteria group bacterium]|nr:hypothetical protein [Patescibacteria group bacterium]